MSLLLLDDSCFLSSLRVLELELLPLRSDRGKKEWEMFVSCFLKHGLWCPIHLEVGLEYVAGEGRPAGQNCLASVGKLGAWLCKELEGEECWAAVSAGSLGQQVGCQDTRLHMQPLGQQPGLQHTKTLCSPKQWTACAQLCLKWALGDGCNIDRINSSTFTRAPLPFPTNKMWVFFWCSQLPWFHRLSGQYTIDAFIIIENTVWYVKCQSECFLCLCDGGLNLEQGMWFQLALSVTVLSYWERS